MMANGGLIPKQVAFSDPQVESLLKAVEQVDRTSLGFTQITTNMVLTLEPGAGSGGPYDVMLHVYSDTSRTIAFRKTGSGYRWISEQETYTGPKWYKIAGDTFRESITIEYQTEKVDGIPTNELYIRYTGNDTNLTHRALGLAEARDILEKWRVTPVEPEPEANAEGFDLIGVFALCLLLVLLGLGLLVLIAGAACMGAASMMLAAGILSASLVVGILRRSFSAGFRALFIQVGALAGFVAGVGATACIIWAAKTGWDSSMRWIIGIALGALIGTLYGWCLGLVWGRIAQALTRRVENQRK